MFHFIDYSPSFENVQVETQQRTCIRNHGGTLLVLLFPCLWLASIFIQPRTTWVQYTVGWTRLNQLPIKTITHQTHPQADVIWETPQLRFPSQVSLDCASWLLNLTSAVFMKHCSYGSRCSGVCCVIKTLRSMGQEDQKIKTTV